MDKKLTQMYKLLNSYLKKRCAFFFSPYNYLLLFSAIFAIIYLNSMLQHSYLIKGEIKTHFDKNI